MCSTNEVMGRVTAEAMSACKPVIGYDNAGTSELIDQRYTGLLYRGGVENLAETMKEAVDNPIWPSWVLTDGMLPVEISLQKFTLKIYTRL